MPKRYSPEQMREAVALARVVGAEVAAETLGMDARTVRGWLAKAGDPPELQGSASQWTQALELAQAKLASKIASGKLTAVQLATVAGIAERNLTNLGKTQPEQAAPDWGARLHAWVDATYPPALLPLAHGAITRQLSDELHEIESAPGYLPDNTPVERDHDADTQLFDGFRTFLEGIPDLVAWHEAWEVADRERRAQREAQAAADLARYHDIGMRVRWCVENTGKTVAECIAEAPQPLNLDPDTLALLERAEAYRLENQ
jgi:hypothetical protein